MDYQFALLIPRTLFGLLDPERKIPFGSIFSSNCLSIIQSYFTDLTEKSTSSNTALRPDSQTLSLLRRFYVTKSLAKHTVNFYTAQSPTGILLWVDPGIQLSTTRRRRKVSSSRLCMLFNSVLTPKYGR